MKHLKGLFPWFLRFFVFFFLLCVDCLCFCVLLVLLLSEIKLEFQCFMLVNLLEIMAWMC